MIKPFEPIPIVIPAFEVEDDIINLEHDCQMFQTITGQRFRIMREVSGDFLAVEFRSIIDDMPIRATLGEIVYINSDGYLAKMGKETFRKRYRELKS